MRSSLRLFAAYVPSIKFVGGPHVGHIVKAGVHPCAPEGLLPQRAIKSQFTPNMVFQSRNNLSKRFRYRQPDEIEMENVITGGAEIVFRQLH